MKKINVEKFHIQNINNTTIYTSGYNLELFEIFSKDYFYTIPPPPGEFMGINKRPHVSYILNSIVPKTVLNGITYRQFNNWEKQGLFSSDRKGKEWRRYSIVKSVWIKIIQELREIGISIEQIKKIKECMEWHDFHWDVPMPLLEFFIACIIGNKLPILLLVFKDGTAKFTNYNQYKSYDRLYEIGNHLQINLNKIVQEILPDIDLSPIYSPDLEIDADEMKVLTFLRLGFYENVKIHYKDGKMEKLEAMERLAVTNRIVDILKANKYQEIEINQANGKIAAITRKIKRKISEMG